MAEYDKELKQLSKAYVRGVLEHKKANEITRTVLAPHKTMLAQRTADVDRVFAQYKLQCVKDDQSGMYVSRIRVSGQKPLTRELMDDIVNRVAALQSAKLGTWKSVQEAVKETIELVHSMRLVPTFRITVTSKVPRGLTATTLKDAGLGEYDNWLNSFVVAKTNMAKKQTDIAKTKKNLEKKYKEIEAQVETYYKRHQYVSIPVKFQHRISTDFQHLVAVTKSNYFEKRLPQKVKRFLEYVPVKTRNTTKKKFSPAKKDVTKYINERAKSIRVLYDLDLVHIVRGMFQTLQERARVANEKKLQAAKVAPTYKLKVSMKKSSKKALHAPKPTPADHHPTHTHDAACDPGDSGDNSMHKRKHTDIASGLVSSTSSVSSEPSAHRSIRPPSSHSNRHRRKRIKA